MKRLKKLGQEIDFNHRNFDFISGFRNIVKDENGYQLENVFEPDGEDYLVKHGEFDIDEYMNLQFSKCCCCSHGNTSAIGEVETFFCDCVAKIQKCELYSFETRCDRIYKCDAYDEVSRINYIASEQEMIDFIIKVSNFFDSPEGYEEYFGFERQYDEDTGKILETVQEYYNRGGKFANIPTSYPAIIVFDYSGKGELMFESMDKLCKKVGEQSGIV